MFIVWYPSEFSRLHNLYPWYWNSLLYSLISSGENSAFAHFAAAIVDHYNLDFSFTRYPSLLGGQRLYDMRGLPDNSTHSRQRDSNTSQWHVVIHLSTNQAWHCLTLMIGQELVTIRPCATIRYRKDN